MAIERKAMQKYTHEGDIIEVDYETPEGVIYGWLHHRDCETRELRLFEPGALRDNPPIAAFDEDIVKRKAEIARLAKECDRYERAVSDAKAQWERCITELSHYENLQCLPEILKRGAGWAVSLGGCVPTLHDLSEAPFDSVTIAELKYQGGRVWFIGKTYRDTYDIHCRLFVAENDARMAWEAAMTEYALKLVKTNQQYHQTYDQVCKETGFDPPDEYKQWDAANRERKSQERKAQIKAELARMEGS